MLRPSVDSSQHAIANGAYRELVGRSVSPAEVERKTRRHVQQILLRCLGLDEPEEKEGRNAKPGESP